MRLKLDKALGGYRVWCDGSVVFTHTDITAVKLFLATRALLEIRATEPIGRAWAIADEAIKELES